MINIKVTAYNGKALPEPLAAEFDETGGGIGRAANNTLILPDPERYISRTHAAIVFRSGRYVIQDRGSTTAVYVNGRPLGNGQEAPIVDGDEVVIGGYKLQVAAVSAAASMASEARRTAVTEAGASKDDPLALFGATPSAADPFGDLVRRPATAKAATKIAPDLMDDPFAVPSGKGGQSGGIPSDYDPFASLDVASASTLPDDLDLGLGDTNQKIDELFGLLPSAGADPFAPGGPLSERAIAHDIFPDDSLLSGLGGKPAQHGAPQRNDTPELHASFRPPRGRPDPAIAQRAAPLEVPRPTRTEPNMVLSWDEHGGGSSEIKTMIIGPHPGEAGELAAEPEPQGKDPASSKSAGVGPLGVFGSTAAGADPLRINRPIVARQATAAFRSPPASQEYLPPPGTAQTTPPLFHAAGSRSAAPELCTRDDLLRAFLEGAGVPDLNLPGGLTLQTMRMLGEILREAMQGTLDLLLARAMIKREVRAELTMIVAKENNPLKFSPNVETALTHLLAPRTRGFLPPLQAMRDAYDDLRSHQIGFMAGMRAALAGVLLRFKPEQLAERLTRKTMLDSLMPMNRKAKLWDLFEELYGDISKEAEDDFHALFGKEFLRAYQAQIDKLDRDDEGAKR